jgi:hypothetical protein
MYHAPDREHVCCGSHDAALQTARHTHDQWVRQFIQHVPARLERRTATGQSSKTAPVALIPADTHVIDTSCG